MVKNYTDEKLLMECKKYWEKLHKHSEKINMKEKSEFKQEILENKEELDFDVDYFIKIFEELTKRCKNDSSNITRQDLNSVGPVNNFFR